MSRDFETLYYEQQAEFTEERGILAQERDNWKKRAEEAERSFANSAKELDEMRVEISRLYNEEIPGLVMAEEASRTRLATVEAYAEQISGAAVRVSKELRARFMARMPDALSSALNDLDAALAKNQRQGADSPTHAESDVSAPSTPRATTVTGPSDERCVSVQSAPATPGVELTVSRTDADYAIEHAGYFLDAFRHYENAHEAAAVASDDYEDEKIDFDAYERAYAAEAEAMGKLRDLAYEFEKRRDRALATVAPRVEGR